MIERPGRATTTSSPLLTTRMLRTAAKTASLPTGKRTHLSAHDIRHAAVTHAQEALPFNGRDSALDTPLQKTQTAQKQNLRQVLVATP